MDGGDALLDSIIGAYARINTVCVEQKNMSEHWIRPRRALVNCSVVCVHSSMAMSVGTPQLAKP